MTIAEFLEARITEDVAALAASADLIKWADDDVQDIRRFVQSRRERECAAKRALMALHEEETGYRGQPQCAQCADGGQADWPCATVRILAAVYSDHPDFNPTWSTT